jgi:hypothetical protein
MVKNAIRPEAHSWLKQQKFLTGIPFCFPDDSSIYTLLPPSAMFQPGFRCAGSGEARW